MNKIPLIALISGAKSSIQSFGNSMMPGMMDCSMMKDGMMGGGKTGASPEAMMEKRMDMMQMMREQMKSPQSQPLPAK